MSLVKTLPMLTLIFLSGCSLVQWLPSSNCHYVEYVRVASSVTVKAECEL